MTWARRPREMPTSALQQIGSIQSAKLGAGCVISTGAKKLLYLLDPTNRPSGAIGWESRYRSQRGRAKYNYFSHTKNLISSIQRSNFCPGLTVKSSEYNAEGVIDSGLGLPQKGS